MEPNVTESLLVVLAHPDDEVGCAGTIAAHVARGQRVVLAFLTRGEMTEALGPLPPAEIAAKREQHARAAGAIMGCEVRFLEYQDTRVEVCAAASYDVAKLVADVKPGAVLTWGDGWMRGIRHPDHQATSQIVRNAVTLARIAKVTAPVTAHRGVAPVFTLRDRHSLLPAVAIDVTPHMATILEVGAFYRERVGWPPEDWHRGRLADAGREYGVAAAEKFDAYESVAGLYGALTESAVLPPL
jgi:N-acetylglucosamine malate deacetylase 1